MQEVVAMEVLDSLDDLIGNYTRGFDAESLVAVLKQILETWSEHLHDHAVVFSFLACPVDLRNAITSAQYFVNFAFVHQLGVSCVRKF